MSTPLTSETDLCTQARRSEYLVGALLVLNSCSAAWLLHEPLLLFFGALASWNIWDAYSFWKRQQRLSDRIDRLEREQEQIQRELLHK